MSAAKDPKPHATDRYASSGGGKPAVGGKPATPAKPLIREWHTMEPAEQATEWQALVAWVVWIHDLYELSRTERLPRCWHQHPGLVEELRSLKAWREHIYDTPNAATTPHVARSWHGELRQSIAAATTFWAAGCRVGHQGADLLAASAAPWPATWAAAGPPVMASAPPAPAGDTGSPATDAITAEAMFAALKTGTARRHSRALPSVARYDHAWWRRGEDSTWVRVDDEQDAADLDESARRMRAADASHDKHTKREDQQ
jgi:hypothetical protein